MPTYRYIIQAATASAHFPDRRFRTTSRRISDQFLDAYDAGGGVVSCSGMDPQMRIAWRELHRPLRDWGTLMPEEETDKVRRSVRSQRRRPLPNVDESNWKTCRVESATRVIRLRSSFSNGLYFLSPMTAGPIAES